MGGRPALHGKSIFHAGVEGEEYRNWWATIKAAYHARIEHGWIGMKSGDQGGGDEEAGDLQRKDQLSVDTARCSTPGIRDDDLMRLTCAAAPPAWDWSFFVPPPARLRWTGTKWTMTPQTNDAYSSSLRDIVFPAGMHCGLRCT